MTLLDFQRYDIAKRTAEKQRQSEVEAEKTFKPLDVEGVKSAGIGFIASGDRAISSIGAAMEGTGKIQASQPVGKDRSWTEKITDPFSFKQKMIEKSPYLKKLNKMVALKTAYTGKAIKETYGDTADKLTEMEGYKEELQSFRGEDGKIKLKNFADLNKVINIGSSGFASMVPVSVAAMATGPAGAVYTGIAMEKGSSFVEYSENLAKEKGVKVEDLSIEDLQRVDDMSTIYGIMAGSLEAITPAKFVNRIGGKKVYNGIMKSVFARMPYETLMGIVTEGGTEGLQRFTQNVIGKLSDISPDQSLWDGVMDEALAGAILGMGSGAVSGIAPVRNEGTDEGAGKEKEEDGAIPPPENEPSPLNLPETKSDQLLIDAFNELPKESEALVERMINEKITAEDLSALSDKALVPMAMTLQYAQEATSTDTAIVKHNLDLIKSTGITIPTIDNTQITADIEAARLSDVAQEATVAPKPVVGTKTPKPKSDAVVVAKTAEKDPLTKEARKYKSADEFVKAQIVKRKLLKKNITINKDNTVTLYHASSPENIKNIIKTGTLRGGGTATGGMTGLKLEPSAFLGLDKKWVKDTWGRSGDVIEIKVPFKDIRQPALNDFEVYFEGGLKRGDNGIWTPTKKPRDTFYNKLADDRKTKSQLTDIYNKAKIKEVVGKPSEQKPKQDAVVHKAAKAREDRLTKEGRIEKTEKKAETKEKKKESSEKRPTEIDDFIGNTDDKGRKATAIEIDKDVVETKTKPRIKKALEETKSNKIEINANSQAQAEVLTLLEEAKAGKKVPLTQDGETTGIIAEKSTFPDWIPEEYRRNSIIKPVLEHIRNGTYPTSKTQQRFYAEIKDEIKRNEPAFTRKNFDRSNQKFISGKEAIKRALAVAKRMKMTNLDTELLETIIADEQGGEAMAISYGSMVGFNEVVTEFAGEHEIGHTLFRNLERFEIFRKYGITRSSLMKEARARHPEITDRQDLQETIMEDLETYLIGRLEGKPTTLVGKTKLFFDGLFNWMKRVFSPENISKTQRFYKLIESGKNKENVQLKQAYGQDKAFMKFFNFGKSQKEIQLEESWDAMQKNKVTSKYKTTIRQIEKAQRGIEKQLSKERARIVREQKKEAGFIKKPVVNEQSEMVKSLITDKGNTKPVEVLRYAWKKLYKEEAPKDVADMLHRNDIDLVRRGIMGGFMTGKQVQRMKQKEMNVAKRIKQAEKNKILRKKINDKWKDKNATKEEKRKLAEGYVKTNLAKEFQGEYLTAVRTSTSDATLQKTILRVDRRKKRNEIKDLTKSIQKALKKLHLLPVATQEDIIAITDRVELKNHTKAFMEKISANKQLYDSISDDMKNNTSRKVLEELKILNRTPLENLSSQKLMEINNKIQQLSIVGRFELEAKREAKENLLETKLAEIKEGSTNLDKLSEREKTNVLSQHKLTKKEKRSLKARKIQAGLKANSLAQAGIDRVVRIADKGIDDESGPNAKYIVVPVDEANNKSIDERDNWKDITLGLVLDEARASMPSGKKLAEKIKKHRKSVFKTDKHTSINDALNDAKIWVMYPKLVYKHIKEFDQLSEKLGVYMHSLNDVSMEKLIQNNNMTLEEIQENTAEVEAMPEDIQNLIKVMKRDLERIWPELSDAYTKLYPTKKLGKIMDNFWPNKTDYEMSDELKDVDDTENRLASVRFSSLKERARRGSDQVLSVDAFQDYQNYMEAAIHFKNMAEPIAAANSIVNSKEYKDSVGTLIRDHMQMWLRIVAKKGAPLRKKIWIEKKMDFLRRNLAPGILGMRPSTIVRQESAYLNGASVIGEDYMRRGTKKILDKNWREFMMEKSVQMRHRLGGDVMFQDLSKAQFTKAMQEFTTKGIKLADFGPAAATWFGAYTKKMEELGLDTTTPEFNNEALRYADRVMRMTQATASYAHAPQVLFNENMTFWRSFHMFETFVLSNWQQMSKDLPAQWRKDKKKGAKMAAFLLLQNAMDAAVTMGVAVATNAIFDDDDDRDKNYVRALVSTIASNIPFVNKLIGSLTYGGGTQVVLVEYVTDILQDFYLTFNATKSKTKQKHLFRGTMNSIMAVTGLPPSYVTQIMYKIIGK